MAPLFSNPNIQEDSKGLINKNEVISALKQLISDYPLDTVPQDAVENALIKIIDQHNVSLIGNNPAFKRFEETIAKAKTIIK